jgi:hypothetical protein
MAANSADSPDLLFAFSSGAMKNRNAPDVENGGRAPSLRDSTFLAAATVAAYVDRGAFMSARARTEN